MSVEFGASTLLYERASYFSVQEDEAHRLAEHLVIARRLISERPAVERPAMARELVTERYDVHWSPHPAPGFPTPKLVRMRDQILAWEPDLARSGLRLRLAPLPQGRTIVGDFRLDDGSYVAFRMGGVTQGWTFTFSRILLALGPALLLLILSALLIRTTLRPLRMLVRATTQVGRGDHAPVVEQGTQEVRSLIHAFNEMQARIHDLIESRTQALAAVGHDLRTPLARLQLRLDNVAGAEGRDAMLADVAEMEAMIASLLAFLSGQEEPEPLVRTDIAVMAQTLVDDAEDRGHRTRYDGPDHLEMAVRPSALRRALSNLVENALHYGGGGVMLTLRAEPDGALIFVDDDGPGIAPDQLEAVTRPFVRLDAERGRNTSGLGLGLAIVTQAVADHGGTLSLSNRGEGGLRACIWLPGPK